MPAGEGSMYSERGDIYTLKAPATPPTARSASFEATLPPDGGPIAHAHMRTDEAFYILFGELEILDGGRTFMPAAAISYSCIEFLPEEAGHAR